MIANDHLCREYDRLMGEARVGLARARQTRNVLLAVVGAITLIGLSLLAVNVIDPAAFARGLSGVVLGLVYAALAHREVCDWETIVEGDR